MESHQQFLKLEKALTTSGFQGMLEYEVTEYLYTNQEEPNFLDFQYGRFVQYYYLSDQIIKVVLDGQRFTVKIYVKYFNQPIYKVYDWRLNITFSELSVFYGRSWMKSFLSNNYDLLKYTGWDNLWFSFLLEMGHYTQVETVVDDQSFLQLPRVTLFDTSNDFILSKGKIYYQFGEVVTDTYRRILTFKCFKEDITIDKLNDQFLWASAFKKVNIPNPYYLEENKKISFSQSTNEKHLTISSRVTKPKVEHKYLGSLNKPTYNIYLIELIEKHFKLKLSDSQKESPKQTLSQLAMKNDPKLVNQILLDLKQKFG